MIRIAATHSNSIKENAWIGPAPAGGSVEVLPDPDGFDVWMQRVRASQECRQSPATCLRLRADPRSIASKERHEHRGATCCKACPGGYIDHPLGQTHRTENVGGLDPRPAHPPVCIEADTDEVPPVSGILERFTQVYRPRRRYRSGSSLETAHRRYSEEKGGDQGGDRISRKPQQSCPLELAMEERLPGLDRNLPRVHRTSHGNEGWAHEIVVSHGGASRRYDQVRVEKSFPKR